MVRYFVVLPPLSGFCEEEKEGVQRISSTSVRLTTNPKRAKKCKNLLLVLLSIMVAAAAAAATRARLGSGFCTQAVSPTLLWERGWRDCGRSTVRLRFLLEASQQPSHHIHRVLGRVS